MDGLGLGLISALMAQPDVLRLWLGWLIFLNLVAPLLFIGRAEGVCVLVVFLLNAILMGQLFEHYGYAKVLGLSHLIFWPPMLLWLGSRWWGMDALVMRLWIVLLFLSNGASLVIDAYDVGRFFLIH